MSASPSHAAAVRGRVNRLRGEIAQTIIQRRLQALGVLMLEPVHTPWRLRRVGCRIVGATPLAKVSGDFRGIAPGGAGRSILVEVKFRPARLLFSDLEPHQRLALDSNASAGGLSYLAWVWDGGDALLAWPIPGFLPRTSISAGAAMAQNVVAIPR